MPRYDVVTMGETMMRLTPPGYERIEQTRRFEIWVGGTESNTAIGLSRLGMKTAWLSRLPATPMGRYISSRVAQYGVDVSHVVWAAETERLGIFFHERSQPPRASRIIYDRRDSAMSRMRPADLPSALFDEPAANLFHITGITLAISQSARETGLEALRRAKQSGSQISFDTNYRAGLWSGAEAAEQCQAAMSEADIIFCPHGDFEIMYGDAEAKDALDDLARMYPQAIVIMTRGIDGAIAKSPGGEAFKQPAIVAGEVGRIGGGDAFAAGFLYAWLKWRDMERALKWGAAMSAHKYTIPGDLPLVDKEAVAALVAGADTGGLQR